MSVLSLPDISLLQISLPEAFGYLAALLTLAAFLMKTMVPVRILAIGANIAFIIYGALAGLMPPLLLHCALVPVNAIRLIQMLRLTRAVREAARGDLNLAWLTPFMLARPTAPGERIFSRGEPADALFLVVQGRFLLPELGTIVGPGEVLGELGLVAEDNLRTQSLESLGEGHLLTISYAQVRRLYFQNPLFAFYLLKLIGRRFMADIRRLEGQLATAPAGRLAEADALPSRSFSEVVR